MTNSETFVTMNSASIITTDPTSGTMNSTSIGTTDQIKVIKLILLYFIVKACGMIRLKACAIDRNNWISRLIALEFFRIQV